MFILFFLPEGNSSEDYELRRLLGDIDTPKTPKTPKRPNNEEDEELEISEYDEGGIKYKKGFAPQ